MPECPKPNRFLQGILFPFLFSCLINGNSGLLALDTCHVVNSLRIDNTDCMGLNKMIVIFPCPQTNQYQTATQMNFHSAELLDAPKTKDKCLKYTLLRTNIQGTGVPFELNYQFDIPFRQVMVYFDLITGNPVSVTETEQHRFGIYRNPPSDRIINTGMILNGVAVAEVYSMTGVLLLRQAIGNTVELDISLLEAGMYFLKLLKKTVLILSNS
ncbi:MAG TPA: T9SS type A sorting domain-containing protein [Bacteroidetes bacterium]|nr:T9SS type A sorting domain-containing protein [Bacteroidota bacterium]